MNRTSVVSEEDFKLKVDELAEKLGAGHGGALNGEAKLQLAMELRGAMADRGQYVPTSLDLNFVDKPIQ